MDDNVFAGGGVDAAIDLTNEIDDQHYGNARLLFSLSKTLLITFQPLKKKNMREQTS